MREEREGMIDSTRIPINPPDTDDDFNKDTYNLVILHLPTNSLSVLVHWRLVLMLSVVVVWLPLGQLMSIPQQMRSDVVGKTQDFTGLRAISLPHKQI